jgi:uncharacterized membrane protein
MNKARLILAFGSIILLIVACSIIILLGGKG